MRASVTALSAVIVLTALPTMNQAQTRTTTRGALGGAVSPDVTQGIVRGALPQGATVGAGRGALPADAVVGAVRNAPPTSIGGFWSQPPVAVTPFTPQYIRVGVVPLRGTASPGAVGAFGAPIPSNTVLGQPGSEELAERLNSEARMSMWRGNYLQGEAMLNRSISIREEIAGGPVHPEVAGALEESAKFLREWSRDAAAADMEARAKEIRTQLEPPPAAKQPERF